MTRHLPHVQRQLPCLCNCIFSFSFGAFVSADTLSWAHKHSCIQTTWILPKEKTSVWCVSNSCGLQFIPLSDCCTANTSMSHCRGTQAISAVLLICLSFYMSFALQYVELSLLVASKPQVYTDTSLLPCNPYRRFAQVCVQHALAAGQGQRSAVSPFCNWESIRQCWLIQNN